MEELERLWEALQTTEFKGRTLGGCEIFILQKKLWVVTELKNKQILSKEDWKKFIFEYPQYGRSCPYPDPDHDRSGKLQISVHRLVGIG